MLPPPATLKIKKSFHTILRNLRDFLLARTRLSNLAVLFLLLLSFYGLLNAYIESPTNVYYQNCNMCISSAMSAAITRQENASSLDHLIIVPGHAVWKGGDPRSRLDDDQWILEPYQKSGGRVAAFFAHIQRGAELVQEDETSLLVFSGGQTRLLSTTTEAQSYLTLAIAADVFRSSAPYPRVTTEDYALDSFQNLLFSIARFHEYTGKYPVQITVIGYEFKRPRFVNLHRAALRWPAERFHYIGINPEDHHSLAVVRDEREYGYLPYSKDLYGCHSQLLMKRQRRNPFVRFHPYYTSSPELQSLLDWCPIASDGGEAALFKGDLPWDSS